MVRIGLQIKAALENITGLKPMNEEFRWYLKLRCASCGEESKMVYVTLNDTMPIKGSRGTANIVIKCKLCSRENTLNILPDAIAEYNVEDSGKFKVFVVFECRGLEPIDFEARSGFCASSTESSCNFEDIDLSEKEWTEYDENAQKPVSILELSHKFCKM